MRGVHPSLRGRERAVLSRASGYACISSLCRGAEIRLIATIGIESESEPYRVPTFSPVIAANLDQAEQDGPEMSIPVDLGGAVR